MSERYHQHEFKQNVISNHRRCFKALFCRVCTDIGMFHKDGEMVHLEAHHLLPYKDTHSQDSSWGILVGSYAHAQLHNSNGSLTKAGISLYEQSHDMPDEPFYDIGIECKGKIDMGIPFDVQLSKILR